MNGSGTGYTTCSECGKDTGFGLLCDDCSSTITRKPQPGPTATASKPEGGSASRRLLEQDPKTYDQGFKAGRSGFDISACPHPAGCNESWSWTSGFIEGKARRLRAV
jgi:hypothetical protein